jgi:hypothetical protein
MRIVTGRVGAALMAAAAAVMVPHGTSSAASGAHQVSYRVTTTSGLMANIYYMATEPPSKDVYGANSSPYLVTVRTEIGPGTPWAFQTTMNDPNQWAIVTASGGLRVNPEFHCEITVDGQVLVSQNGGSGVQCLTHPW